MKPALVIALGLSLGATAWLAWRDARTPEGTELVNARPHRPVAPGSAATREPRAMPSPLTVTRSPGLPARPADWPAASRQALGAWQLPPPPPPPPAPPQAAEAPPAPPPRPAVPRFPYQWLGLLDDGRRPQALLASAQRAAPLAVGEVIDGRWRLDSLSPGQLELTHLPSGERLTLRPTPAAPASPAAPQQEPA